MKIINFTNRIENKTRKINLKINVPVWLSIIILVAIIYLVVK